MVLYVASGCTQCDSPATGLDRVWRDAKGELHTDRLFDRSTPAAQSNTGYITSMAVSGDGSRIVIGTCEGAYCGGVANVASGAKVLFHASDDGGITWRPFGMVDGGAWVVAPGQTAGSPAIARRTYQKPDATWAWEFVQLPGGQHVDSVASASISDQFTLRFGETVLYRGADRTSLWNLQDASNPAFSIELPAGADLQNAFMIAGSSRHLWAAEFVQEGKQGRWLGIMDQRYGRPAKIFGYTAGVSPLLLTYFTANASASPATSSAIALNAWMPRSALGDRSATGGAYVPAVLDLETGTVRAFRELIPRATTGGVAGAGDRTHILGVATGAFVQVKGAGDCLNVRSAPSTSAQVLGCFADGVLLRQTGEARDADGIRWLGVTTLAGAQGWASAEFLPGADQGVVTSGTYPVGTRTNEPAIDTVIAAIESGDRAKIGAVIGWGKVACVTKQEGIGAPPLCPEGVAEGTGLEAISGACMEGYFVMRQDFESGTGRPFGDTNGLYAVYRESPPGLPARVVLFFGPAQPFATKVYLVNAKIAGYSSCLSDPAGELSQVPASAFILPPKR